MEDKLKITTGKAFRQEIEMIVEEHNVGYIDAIVEFCQRNGMEVETVAKLVSGNFRDKVKLEAEELRMIKDEDA